MDTCTSDSHLIQLTPAALHQLLTVRASLALTKAFEEFATVVQVVGRLAGLGQARGTWHYGVRVSDDGGFVLVDCPVALVKARNIKDGDLVRVVGIIRVRKSNRAFEIELRLEASEIAKATESGQSPATKDGGRLDIPQLKSFANTRHRFPQLSSDHVLQVVVIRSVSPKAQVGEDCLGQLQRVRGYLAVSERSVSMLNPVQIASTIDAAACDVLIIIRGGGEDTDFLVFDDPRVVGALAANSAYRIVGVGHAGNRTLLDLFADFPATTPTDAGRHVAEMIGAVVTHRQRSDQRLADATSAIERQLVQAMRDKQDAVERVRKMETTRHRLIIWVMLALVLGIIVGVAIRN